MAKVNEYIDIVAYKNTLKCINKDLFTSGNIRVNKLRISLDSWWDNLSKWFCFRVRDNVCYADEVENIGSDIIVTIPSSIFTKENIGNTCFFGIYGSEGEEPNIALSTEWYNIGKIEEGVYATNALIAEADSFLAAVDAKINNAAQLAVNSAELSLNEDYVLTLTAKNEKGEILSSSFIDLPIEELVKEGRYDEENKEIVLILEDGKEIRVPVGDLVENKVDKLDTEYVVYATDDSRPPKTIGKRYSNQPVKSAIAVRDYIGSLQVPTAQDDTQAVNKGQMDTALDGKVDKTTIANKIYGTGINGEPNLYAQSSGNAVRFTVPLRNNNGAIVAANPTQDNELTTKEYVDNLIQGFAKNRVFTDSVTIVDPEADTTGGTNTKITDRTIDMWSRAGGEELKITLGDDPDVYYRNRGQSKYGNAKFEDIVNVANAYAGASFYLTPFTVDNLKAGTVEVQDGLILKSSNGTKYKISVNDDGSLTTNKIDN